MHRRLAAAHILLLCSIGAACNTERILEQATPFTIAPRNSLVQEGMLVQLEAYLATDASVNADPMVWSSSNASVAEVDSKGMVTALSAGVVTIRAMSGTVVDSTLVTVTSADKGSLVAFGRTTCGATTTAGEVCWGENRYGQTGTRIPNEIVFVPTPVPAAVTWRSLDGGWNHACGVDTLYDIYCWGLNNFGQLGMGTFSDPVLPSRKVETDKKFVVVSAGGIDWQTRFDGDVYSAQLTCGLSRTGEVYCWGSPGNLFTTGEQPSSVPKRVAPGLLFASISVGNAYACGVTIDRRGYCWGNNDLGQLGRAQSSLDRAPREIEGNLRFEQISAGGIHACGTTVNGDAYCWGANESLQLGASTTGKCLFRGVETSCQTRPVAVAGGFKFKSVQASDWGSPEAVTAFELTLRGHSCGLTPEQDIVCWGNNESGRIKRRLDFTEPFSLAPVKLPFLEKFRTLAVGESHTCAVLVNGGQVWCWGDGTRGQRGIPQGTFAIDFAAVAGAFVYK